MKRIIFLYCSRFAIYKIHGYGFVVVIWRVRFVGVCRIGFVVVYWVEFVVVCKIGFVFVYRVGFVVVCRVGLVVVRRVGFVVNLYRQII